MPDQISLKRIQKKEWGDILLRKEQSSYMTQLLPNEVSCKTKECYFRKQAHQQYLSLEISDIIETCRKNKEGISMIMFNQGDRTDLLGYTARLGSLSVETSLVLRVIYYNESTGLVFICLWKANILGQRKSTFTNAGIEARTEEEKFMALE
ncbi:hypothetical protein Tco_0145955 [Tanacetum coccineum]|uniref:Uncharacterized protein n=1 Tax=Tanacetum coccineum TaxID=301880 RepID=A0ABQ5DEZ1_9ASTR